MAQDDQINGSTAFCFGLSACPGILHERGSWEKPQLLGGSSTGIMNPVLGTSGSRRGVLNRTPTIILGHNQGCVNDLPTLPGPALRIRSFFPGSRV